MRVALLSGVVVLLGEAAWRAVRPGFAAPDRCVECKSFLVRRTEKATRPSKPTWGVWCPRCHGWWPEDGANRTDLDRPAQWTLTHDPPTITRRPERGQPIVSRHSWLTGRTPPWSRCRHRPRPAARCRPSGTSDEPSSTGRRSNRKQLALPIAPPWRASCRGPAQGDAGPVGVAGRSAVRVPVLYPAGAEVD